MRTAMLTDLEVFDLCARFQLRHASLQAVIGGERDEEAVEREFLARYEIASRLREVRPLTEAGRRAKAAVAVVLLDEVTKPSIGAGFARATLCDFTGAEPR